MIQRPKITLTLPKELIEITDEKRGLISRSRYFEFIISEFLNKKNNISITKIVTGGSKPSSGVFTETTKYNQGGNLN